MTGTLGRHEDFIVRAWMRPDVPIEHRDIATFVAELGADHDRPRTSEERWLTFRRIQREIGAGALSTVTSAQVRSWWFGVGQLRRGGGLRSPATRRAMIDHLAAFMWWAIAGDRRTDNPLKGLPVVRVGRSEPRPADRAAVDRVIAAADEPARTTILLATGLGLRCCEIAVLTRDDLQYIDDGWWLWLTRKGGHRLRCAVPCGIAGKLAASRPVIRSYPPGPAGT
jgi:integrase